MDEQISRFVSFIGHGITSWIDAGCLLIVMQRTDKNIFNKIIARCEWLTVDTLMTFVRIGRLELRPEVLLLNASTGNHLLKLGYSQQSKLLDERVSVAVDIKQDGKAVVQQKKLTELTQSDLKTLINKSKIRTPIEQEQFLRARLNAKVADAVTKPLIKEQLVKPEKKLMFLGCYRIVMRSGVPSISKAATLPLNAQRVLMVNNMGDTDCFVELTKWSE